MSDVLLDPTAIAIALQRMSFEIIERSRNRPKRELPMLVAVRRGGDQLARRIAKFIEESTGKRPTCGAVDITLYRDDAATQLANLKVGPSDIPVSIDGLWVVLVDDVISTGRTIRAALDALLDFGRPSNVELAALIDRGGRELPIQPDYVGLKVEAPKDRRVEVMLKRSGPGDDDREPWAILLPPSPKPSVRGAR